MALPYQEAEEDYRAIVTQGPKKLADPMQALRGYLEQDEVRTVTDVATRACVQRIVCSGGFGQ